jgi:hypothetical protein
MSNSYLYFRERSSDVQDHVERHVWGELEYIEAGAIIKVKGTDTEDQEANVIVPGSGASFKLKKDTDSEVFLLASSSDTNLKLALLTIPRDKQRRWKEGQGGIQHPTDPEFALDFSDKLAHVTKNKFAVGEKGELEVRGGDVYIRGRLIVEKEVVANKLVKTPQVVNGTEGIPGFEGNKQEEKKSSGGGGGGAASIQMSFEFDEPFDGNGLA